MNISQAFPSRDLARCCFKCFTCLKEAFRLKETKRFIRDDAVHSRWHWWGCGRPMHRDTSLRGDQIIEECQPDLTSGDLVHYYNLWSTTSCHEFDQTKILLNCILK
jgi:hypothetical protein